jgi:hypothetical protein
MQNHCRTYYLRFIHLQFICDANPDEKCIPAKRIIGGNKDIKGRFIYKNAHWLL